MEFFRIKRDIPFMRHALVLNVISFITFAAAVFFLFSRGLHLSIEFTGGTVLEVEYVQTADIGRTRAAVEALDFGEVQVQNFGTSRDVLIRLPVRGNMTGSVVAAKVFEGLCKAEQGTVGTKQYITPQGEAVSRPSCTAASGTEPIKLMRTEFVGPSVGDELARDGALALGVTCLLYTSIGSSPPTSTRPGTSTACRPRCCSTRAGSACWPVWPWRLPRW